MIINNDMIFSYWIIIWFILYILNITTYNPLFILIIGYVIVILEFIYLIYIKTKKYNLIKFFIINIIIKFIPILYIIYKLNYNFNIKLKDIYFSFYLLIIYIIYIYIIYNKNPIVFYNILLNSYIQDNKEYRSVFSKSFDYIYDEIIKIKK